MDERVVLVGISGKLGSGKNEAAKQIEKLTRGVWSNVREKAFAEKIKLIVAAITGTTVEEQYLENVKNMDPRKLVNFKEETSSALRSKARKVVSIMTSTEDSDKVPKELMSPLHKKTIGELREDIVQYYTKFLREGELPLDYWTCGGLQQHLGTYFRKFYREDIWAVSLFLDYDPRESWLITDLRFPNEVEEIKRRGGILIRMEGDPCGVRNRSKRDPNHISETALDSFQGWDIIIKNDKEDLDNLRNQLQTFLVTHNLVPTEKEEKNYYTENAKSVEFEEHLEKTDSLRKESKRDIGLN
jgi:hypothetical protein